MGWCVAVVSCFLRLSRMKVAAEGRLRSMKASSSSASSYVSMVTVTARVGWT